MPYFKTVVRNKWFGPLKLFLSLLRNTILLLPIALTGEFEEFKIILFIHILFYSFIINFMLRVTNIVTIN